MPRYSLFLLALPVGLAGCTPVDMAFGETHRWNIEQQVADPDPHYAATELEAGSGEHAAGAVDRYNRGVVKQPATVDTTVRGSAAGAAGGASTGSGSGPR